MSNEDFPPKLGQGQRSVVFAEANTGTPTAPVGQHRIGQAKGYRVFSSDEEAMAFAQFYIERNPTMEVSICDEDGNQISYFRRQE